MMLKGPSANRANTFYVFLKKQSKKYLREQNISKCETCEGLGLDNITQFDRAKSWDGVSYCNDCDGVGYRGVQGGVQVDLLHYICRECDGIGCQFCSNGIVDWIDHSMGR